MSAPPVDVSVIIPARNAGPSIGRQIEAVAAQRVMGRFEIVVVDNGSTDATVAAALAADRGQINLRLVDGPSEPNRSAARNAGVRASAGQILAFCDADDVVEPGWLAHLVDGLDHHEVVTGSLVRVRDADEGATGDAGSAPSFRGFPTLASGNFAIRKAIYEKVGGFDETFANRVDTELSCRLHTLGISVGYEPRAVVRYARRPGSGQELRQSFLWGVTEARILRMYRSRVPLAYRWTNSVKHGVLVWPRLLTGLARRRDVTPELLTIGTLAGRLVGSVRHRVWAV